MAIVAVFNLPNVTKAQYDQSAARLTGGGMLKGPDDWPVPGLITHVAAPTPTGWLVVDVWESHDAFEQFAAQLMPVLDELGIPVAAPEIHPVHNLVTTSPAESNATGAVPHPES